MTFDDMIYDIGERLRRPFSTDSDAKTQIRRWINRSMEEMQRRGEWWFLEKAGTVTVTNTQFFDIPSDFDRMDHQTMRTADSPLEFVSIADIDALDPDFSDTGTPERFGFLGKQFFFHPYPSTGFVSDGSLKYRYYRNVRLLATTGTGVSGTTYSDTESPDYPVSHQETVLLGALYRGQNFVYGGGAGTQTKQEFMGEIAELQGRGPTVGSPGNTEAVVAGHSFARLVRP